MLSQSVVPLCLLPGRITPLKPVHWQLGPTRKQIAHTALTGSSSTKCAALPKWSLYSGQTPTTVSPQKMVELTVVLTVNREINKNPCEWLQHIKIMQGCGITIQLVSDKKDPETNVGKKSSMIAVNGSLLPSDILQSHRYTANLTVPADFGNPGAIIVTNIHDKEFFLTEIVVKGFAEDISFPAESWIHSKKDNPTSRIIFSNKAYLPSKTPAGLTHLRKEDLEALRGNGEGERKKHDRIYDYAPYNDLGDTRPVLGGYEMHYPRRCRTGRPPLESDPTYETRLEAPAQNYVPRDENFANIKNIAFNLRGLLNRTRGNFFLKIFFGNAGHFKRFSDIDKLYNDNLSWITSALLRLIPLPLLKTSVDGKVRYFKYPIPFIVKNYRFVWMGDDEFARQTVAGVNPVNIKLLKSTDFPIRSKLDGKDYGPPESAITKEILESELQGMSLSEAIKKKRLFIIDYHDILLPFVKKVNSLDDRRMYASRTILASTPNGMLRPIAIELSLPHSISNPSPKRVYTPGGEPWVWNLAKAHAAANDAAVHQVVNHWLRTHANMEPYVIAAHRQLSNMHPIFKLLHPHTKDTIHINAQARQVLINAGGSVEVGFCPGKYSLEASSAAYKSDWRFDMEALPEDLKRRGMAVWDPCKKSQVRLVLKDYPYATDSLEVWTAIENWVRNYVNHFYRNNRDVRSDKELKAWWEEIKNKGHPDKKEGWPSLRSRNDLIRILSTIIWTASGLHAAVNFGQYPFGGYMPNRPTVMKKLIPQEGEAAYQELLSDPEHNFLSFMPSKALATLVMGVNHTLSTHYTEEQYLGGDRCNFSNWIHDEDVKKHYSEFSKEIGAIGRKINERNMDPNLKNRNGRGGVPPYLLLHPKSGPGITGRGIPNSISI